MKLKSLISAALIVGCYSFSANAQTPISATTFACGMAAAKAGGKFADKVADTIENCLLAVMACNQKGPGINACVDGLLVAGGKCAAGKLAPAGNYFGPGSTANIDLSIIGKAYGAYRSQLKKCDPSLYAIDYSGLNFPWINPPDLEIVVVSLNDEGNGPACEAHRRVLYTIPARDALINQLLASPNAANLPSAIAAIPDPFTLCK